MLRHALFASLFLGAGCGGPAKGTISGPGSLHGASLPYQVVGRGGKEIPTDRFFDELARARAVCIGEGHDNPHHHWAQLELVSELFRRGFKAVGMEMFQRPFQGVLEDYTRGVIGEDELLARTGWKKRWGYDWELYAPIVRHVRHEGGALLALNVSSELKRKVSNQGLEGLSAADRERLPDMHLQDAEHRAWFDGVMEAMGGAHGHGDAPAAAEGGSAVDAEDGGEVAAKEKRERVNHDAISDRIYTVQVLWDETMAESAVAWLRKGADHRLAILAGNGHCHDLGIVARMRRRGIDGVRSVRPVVDRGQGELAALIAEPKNDFFFVMDPGLAGR